MMQLIDHNVFLLRAIRIDKKELKRLKAFKLISLDLYIWWAAQLTFGLGKTEGIDVEKLESFCQDWSFFYGDYLEGANANFQFCPQDVLIALGKMAKKEGSEVRVAVQLSLVFGEENDEDS